ncbi:MAG: TetR/AcrR family transcriptional regulator [Proteobacteria bacterium]|nr:TetR/AcrR family transcriptional regulator [Pseudomonadota bacterium]
MTRALFDRNAVIDKSIDLFWQKGFSASSMQQVIKATGLKPGSIYLAFGNKEGLFREALDGYTYKGIAKIRETIDKASSVGLGICTLLEEAVKASTKKDYCSCLLLKTQLEFNADTSEFHAYASTKLIEVESVYRSYLEKEYSKFVSRQRAANLMLHLFGLRIYGYQQGSSELMLQGVRDGLPWLPWDE